MVVRVERRFTHATMKKTIRRSKKYHAHDGSAGAPELIERAEVEYAKVKPEIERLITAEAR